VLLFPAILVSQGLPEVPATLERAGFDDYREAAGRLSGGRLLVRLESHGNGMRVR
jgi:hypothetical protein